MSTFYFRTLFLVTVLASICGCALGPDYERPQVLLSEKFIQSGGEGESIANLEWWELFSDPVLVELINVALERNKELGAAVARIERARAILGITRADQFPRLDLRGNATRTDASDEAFAFAVAPFNNFGLFTDLSFEIDIWGRLRRATEAQRAELLSSEYAQRAFVVTLVSEVASTYFTILGLEHRLGISQGTLNNRRGATELIAERLNKGVVPEIDLNQAQIEEASAAVAVTVLERDLRQAEHALSVLLGGLPAEIPRGKSLYDQSFALELPAGFPAELLERRPDVRAAEESAHAAVARVGVAIGDRLPSLNLLGFVGLESIEDSNFFHGNAKTWSIGGSLLGPLIDFGRSSSAIDAAEAEAKEALLGYEQSVIQAVREVEDALVAIRTTREGQKYRENQVTAARNAATLSRTRYDEGIAPYLEVLDIERSLFEAELGASNQRETYLRSVVQLYKALGGGWVQESLLPIHAELAKETPAVDSAS
ncbi:MAG: efflux transporter outer membrane subunit [Deltaproteobacteria bacterium]|nr:efflux transporter outer membrane subunit [Deltaproteobacteria bacterium]